MTVSAGRKVYNETEVIFVKKWLANLALAVALGILFPTVALWTAFRGWESQVPSAPGEPQGIQLLIHMGDGVVEMELETYLVGVVLGEMPADFEKEALKAQAVVARTYSLRRYTRKDKHSDGGVCTDPACCQAYRDPEAYLAGGNGVERLEKVRSAVRETAGQVLTYQGALIDATYFSCSGGRTEDAAAVWGSDVPYLQAVDSPGEENAPRYTETVTFTAREFANALGKSLSGSPGGWFSNITYTDGGGVDTMDICGSTYKGTQLRSLLHLRSTAFVISGVGDTVIITTKGYGHRVGMSQYGADAMAVKGSSFAEILAHYYVGAVLEIYRGN